MPGIRRREWRDGKFVLAGQSQASPAGSQHFEQRAPSQHLGHYRRGGRNVLEVVKHEQHPPVEQEGRQPIHQSHRALLAQLEGLGDRGRHQCGVADGFERDEAFAVLVAGSELRGHVPGETGLTHPARAGKRHQTHVSPAKQRAHACGIALATDQ
jgi:hypothetical protein